jgi:hypothetical protein
MQLMMRGIHPMKNRRSRRNKKSNKRVKRGRNWGFKRKKERRRNRMRKM